MRRYYIRKGDPTTSGGTVVAGFVHCTDNGKEMAGEGHPVWCPACKSTGVIRCVGTRLPNSVNDIELALNGDLCVCRCRPPYPQLIATQSTHWTEGSADAGARASSSNAFAESGLAQAGEDETPHEIQFQAIDPETGRPAPHSPYVLTREDGSEIDGITDRRGLTAIIEASSPERVGIHFFFKSPVGDVIDREDLA